MHSSVAIDGPVGAGKSSVAAGVAWALGLFHLDTGALYRALGVKVLRLGLDPQCQADAEAVCADTQVDVAYVDGAQRTLMDGEDVTGLLRTPQAAMAASAVSKWGQVRRCMVARQQTIAQGMDVVLEGRDIGTRVLPNATLKIFLTAAPEARAMRRHEENLRRGIPSAYEDVLRDLRARDLQDSTRAVDPLRQAEDAVLLDTTSLTLDQAIARIVALYLEKTAKKE
ncbi:MAG: (d)CMP kinase [Oscillospiraceae bacterium]|jgi:cytidylate kinase|nr:(d)CMP kinase [Oscillospiraceae bacterium]